MGFKQFCKDASYLIKSIFRKLVDIPLGVFIYCKSLARIRRAEEKADQRIYFRKETRKQMSKWVSRERKFIAQQSRLKLGKMKNDTVFNYISTVIMNISDHMSPEEMLHQFYDALHPFLVQYHEAACILRNIRKHPPIRHHLKPQEKIFLDRMPDIFKRAEFVLEKKSEISKAIRKMEKELEKNRQLKQEAQDKKLLELEEKMLEDSLKDKQRRLEIVNRTIKEEYGDKKENGPKDAQSNKKGPQKEKGTQKGPKNAKSTRG